MYSRVLCAPIAELADSPRPVVQIYHTNRYVLRAVRDPGAQLRYLPRPYNVGPFGVRSALIGVWALHGRPEENKIGDKGGFIKRKTVLALAVLSAMTFVAAARSFAQDRIEAKIPFAFNVGSRSLPSGSYEFRKAFANTLVIQNAITHQAAMAITTADSPNQIEGDAVVVFHKYGDTYFLSAVQAGNSREALGASRLERQTATKAAETAQNTLPREVYVAAIIH